MHYTASLTIRVRAVKPINAFEFYLYPRLQVSIRRVVAYSLEPGPGQYHILSSPTSVTVTEDIIIKMQDDEDVFDLPARSPVPVPVSLVAHTPSLPPAVNDDTVDVEASAKHLFEDMRKTWRVTARYVKPIYAHGKFSSCMSG